MFTFILQQYAYTFLFISHNYNVHLFFAGDVIPKSLKPNYLTFFSAPSKMSEVLCID